MRRECRGARPAHDQGHHDGDHGVDDGRGGEGLGALEREFLLAAPRGQLQQADGERDREFLKTLMNSEVSGGMMMRRRSAAHGHRPADVRPLASAAELAAGDDSDAGAHLLGDAAAV